MRIKNKHDKEENVIRNWTFNLSMHKTQTHTDTQIYINSVNTHLIREKNARIDMWIQQSINCFALLIDWFYLNENQREWFCLFALFATFLFTDKTINHHRCSFVHSFFSKYKWIVYKCCSLQRSILTTCLFMT